MKALEWGEIGLCLTCSALVPDRLMASHDEWHRRIAAEAIRSAERLDRLTRRP